MKWDADGSSRALYSPRRIPCRAGLPRTESRRDDVIAADTAGRVPTGDSRRAMVSVTAGLPSPTSPVAGSRFHPNYVVSDIRLAASRLGEL